MSLAGFLYGSWVSRPFALVYTKSIAKSIKKALLSYVVLNNSVTSEIVVLTPFSRGERRFVTLMTLSLFLASLRYWRPDAICDAVTLMTLYSLLGHKKKKIKKKKNNKYMSRWQIYRHCSYSVIAFKYWRPNNTFHPLICDAIKSLASQIHLLASQIGY